MSDRPETWEAVKALNERKRAAFSDDHDGIDIDVPGADNAVGRTFRVTRDGLRKVALGFDLDLDELSVCTDFTSGMVMNALRANTGPGAHGDGRVDVRVLVASTWEDGLLTGLMLAELRRQRGGRP